MRELHHDPDARPIVGRQPADAKWTPSAPFAWYGSIFEGERFTKQQIQTLMSKGKDPLTVPVLTVKRQAKLTEYSWPFRELPPLFAMECPIIGKMKDGRVRVIAPNGDVKIVQSDGWAHRPFRQPRDGWGVAA